MRRAKLSEMVAPECPEMTSSDDDDDDDRDDDDDDKPRPPRRVRLRPTWLLYAATILVLTALCVFLGVRYYDDSQQLRRQESFLAEAREGAEMLTTIDAANVQNDVARIIASSTGPFLDDFQRRSPSFVEAVTRAQSTSRGTVLEAGLEQIRGDEADVLVTMAVTTSIKGAQAPPRQWRMRIGVRQDGSTMKVSNVEFVP